MNLITVDSSMIHAVGYDPQTQELEVVFSSGKIYRYSNIPEQIYQQFMAADSKGSYMRSCIIGFYPERKVSRRR